MSKSEMRIQAPPAIHKAFKLRCIIEDRQIYETVLELMRLYGEGKIKLPSDHA